MPATKDISIRQGGTFSLVLRWEAPPIVYKPITAITQSAPVRLTVPSHGVPTGWRVAVTNVKGMTEINASANSVKDADYHPATVVDSNTVEINEINAAGYKAYISGGQLQYNTPVDLSGYSARMSIKDKIGGTELFSLTVLNGRITLDTTLKTISLTISATDTQAVTWKKGVYDLEMVSGTGVVTPILTGKVVVTQEVTT
jgi:hypothetical protein